MKEPGIWEGEQKAGPASMPRPLPLRFAKCSPEDQARGPRKGVWRKSCHHDHCFLVCSYQIMQLSICLGCPTATAWLSSLPTLAGPSPSAQKKETETEFHPRESPSCLHMLWPLQLASCAHRCPHPRAHVDTDTHMHDTMLFTRPQTDWDPMLHAILRVGGGEALSQFMGRVSSSLVVHQNRATLK